MGFLDSLFGKPEPEPKKKKKKKPVAAATATESPVESSSAVAAEGISPEIVAVITASIYAMMGTSNLAVRITRTSNQWVHAGRQKIMDSRQFA